MVAIVSLLVIVTISIVVTRVATSALELTGVSRDLARFQARSAYTGVGFTTNEAESVVVHPVRRRIVLVLMLLGNAGIASVVASLILGFVDDPTRQAALLRLAVLGAGLALLWAATSSAVVNHLLERVIQAVLRRSSQLEVRDYVRILNISGDYSVQEVDVGGQEWLAGAPLRDLQLPDEGILVLGVRRSDGGYLGTPTGDVQLEPGDTAVVYGREEAVVELSERMAGAAGDRAHAEASFHQRHLEQRERERDVGRRRD